jgi:phospholipid transport system substrate-binding protein
MFIALPPLTRRLLLGALLGAFLAAMPGPVTLHADDQTPDAGPLLTAREVLDDTTERVLAVIEEARAYVDEDPERYYAAVHEVLDPFVDFRGFARGVMGDYATTERYRSLDEEGRAALRDQLERFTETMRRGLVRTYSKGLLAFGGSRVAFDDERSNADEQRATLRQLIYSDEAEPYVVIYQMARRRDGKLAAAQPDRRERQPRADLPQPVRVRGAALRRRPRRRDRKLGHADRTAGLTPRVTTRRAVHCGAT